MKRLSLLVAAIAAFSTAACGSTATPAAAADTAVAADSSDVVSVDVTAIDTEAPDSGPADVAKKDTGPKDTGPTLCALTDKACLTTCMKANCDAEVGACDAAKDCTTVAGCIEACKTAECQSGCLANNSKAGVKGLFAMQGCQLNNCVQSDYDGSCPDAKAKNYAACQNACFVQTCLNEFVDFATDPTALTMNSCVNGCKGDQKCQQGCLDAAGATAQKEYQALVTCASTNSCIGN